MVQSENQIQKAIIDYLQIYENLGQLVFIRNNSFAGQIMRHDNSVGYVKNSKKGSPDILIFINKGQVIHLEVKTKKGSLSEDQIKWKKNVEKLGHKFFIARSIDDVDNIIKNLC